MNKYFTILYILLGVRVSFISGQRYYEYMRISNKKISLYTLRLYSKNNNRKLISKMKLRIRYYGDQRIGLA